MYYLDYYLFIYVALNHLISWQKDTIVFQPDIETKLLILL